MEWLKNFIKKLTKNWLKKNKTEIVYIVDDFTDEAFKLGKEEIYKKFPNLPDDAKALLEVFITTMDAEVDKLVTDKIDEIIGGLGDARHIEVKKSEDA